MAQKLKVTDTKTGKVWVDDNEPHSWQALALHIIKSYPDYNLIYCDIECLAKGQTWKVKPDNSWAIEEQWYILDETGRYEPLPEEYVVEEIIDDAERTQS